MKTDDKKSNVFDDDNLAASEPARWMFPTLTVFGICSCAIYYWITSLSHFFEYDNELTERPIPFVLGLFTAAFFLYAASIWIGRRTQQTWQLFLEIAFFAIVFRCIVFYSTPIQEVDIYRYIWDGAVVTQKISPFKYPPEEVKYAVNATTPDTIFEDQELKRLVHMCRRDSALFEVLNRVHFAKLPTVYPATSQAVFAMSELSTPTDADLTTRVRVMKAWLIVFDLATFFLVVKLLSLCRLPIGLSVAYAWCPLLIKEVANSGHLDSIAVFFTTLGVTVLVACLSKIESRQTKSLSTERKSYIFSLGLMAAALFLALGVGAKLFPIVLVPLFCFVTARSAGWLAIPLPAIVFGLVTVGLLWPMLPERSKDDALADQQTSNQQNAQPPAIPPAIPPAQPANGNPTTKPQHDPSLGITKFLGSWEMNDLLFMIVVENLKPEKTFPGNKSIWFSFVSDDFRKQVTAKVIERTEVDERQAPFLATRIATSLLFLIIALLMALRAGRAKHADRMAVIGETAFLTIVWFWLLSPTQNPWYLTWALPFLPFARNRAWVALAGMAMVYYLRFYFLYHFKDDEVWGTSYKSVGFFDFVLVWYEFGLFFIWLAVEWVIRCWVCKDRHPGSSSD